MISIWQTCVSARHVHQAALAPLSYASDHRQGGSSAADAREQDYVKAAAEKPYLSVGQRRVMEGAN